MEFEKEHLKKSRQGERTDLDNVKDPLRTSSSRDPEVKEEPKKPHEESAEDAGVSPATYKRAKYIHKHADEETKQKLRDGDLKIKRVYLYLKAKQNPSKPAYKAPQSLILPCLTLPLHLTKVLLKSHLWRSTFLLSFSELANKFIDVKFPEE